MFNGELSEPPTIIISQNIHVYVKQLRFHVWLSVTGKGGEIRALSPPLGDNCTPYCDPQLTNNVSIVFPIIN